MLLTTEQLKGILPAMNPAVSALYLPILNATLPKYNIDTASRIGAFIAQVGYECINFTTMSEIGTGNEYESRISLGNVYPGDGPRFKGRGAIQVTGRNHYAECSETLFGDDRLLKTPEMLLQPQYAIESACWFWTVAKPTLNTICDRPEDSIFHWEKKQFTKIQYITLLINSGQNGLIARTQYYLRARTVLSF